MGKWSDAAWEAALPVYRRIIEHPFVVELGEGTLSAERFLFYLRQDALYLDGYARRLAHVASRLQRKEHTEAFLRFASDGIEVERALHAVFLQGNMPSDEEVSPTCLLYTSLQDSMATAPVELEATALLPCFRVYQRVGETILKRQQGHENPYRQWIETYGDPQFAAASELAVRICDELAEEATPARQKQMTDIFVRCTRMEWMFWESAWQLEKWKI